MSRLVLLDEICDRLAAAKEIIVQSMQYSFF